MTSSALVLAVDSSTTSTKALVVDGEGTVLAQGQAPIAMSQPGVDRYEQDPAEWVASTEAAISQAVAALSPADRSRVSALGMTAQRQTFALTDEDGTPLRPGIVWLDGRAAAQVASRGSERVHELSGFQPDVTPSLYKIAWLADHEAETLARAAHVTSVHGYLTHAFTGRWTDSAATADSLGLHDMAQLDFADELLTLAGVRRDQLPGLVAPGAVIGQVLPDVAARWGLSGPIALVAGCGDGQAAGLGCGATGPDEAYLNMGTALVAGVHSPTYRFGDVFRTDAAGLAGQYVLEIVQNSGAYLATWFRAELGDPALEGRPDPALDEAASRVPMGVGGLLTLPYWNAVQSPHWDPLARGAIVGLAGAHGRPELYRSLLEGLSIEMGRNLRGLQEATGTPLTRVAVMGGGQRSPLWRRIMTDCVGLPLVECDTAEVSALGAGVLALASVLDEDVTTVSRRVARLGATTEPDPGNVARYAELADLQARLYPALREVFAAQAAFAQH